MNEENLPQEEQAQLREDALSQEDRKPLSADKRAALLRYMAILFAVAFLMVLASLLIQTHSSRAALSEMSKNNSDALSNAMANAEFLQDQNRELQDENRELRAQLEALEDEQDGTDALARQLAALQAEYDALREHATGTERAYEALITALGCKSHEGNVTFSRAMDTVEQNREYLSDEALEIYEALLDEQ